MNDSRMIIQMLKKYSVGNALAFVVNLHLNVTLISVKFYFDIETMIFVKFYFDIETIIFVKFYFDIETIIFVKPGLLKKQESVKLIKRND